jgi:hypothetical protein
MSYLHPRTTSRNRRVDQRWSLFERIGLGISLVVIAAQLGWSHVSHGAQPLEATAAPDTTVTATDLPSDATPSPEASAAPNAQAAATDTALPAASAASETHTAAPTSAPSPQASQPPATTPPASPSPDATHAADAAVDATTAPSASPTAATAAPSASPTAAAPSAPPSAADPGPTPTASVAPTATPPLYARPTIDAETRISISMDPSTSRAAPGDDVDFVLIVSNGGGLPALTRVTSDLADPFAIIAAASPAGVCEVSGNNVVCSVEVPAGGTTSVTIRAFVVPSSPASAAVSSADATGDGFSARAAATVEIAAAPEQAADVAATSTPTQPARGADRREDSDDAPPQQTTEPTQQATATPTTALPVATAASASAVAADLPPTATGVLPSATGTVALAVPAIASPPATLPAAAPPQALPDQVGAVVQEGAPIGTDVAVLSGAPVATASVLLPNTASGGFQPPFVGLGAFVLVLLLRMARLRLRGTRS